MPDDLQLDNLAELDDDTFLFLGVQRGSRPRRFDAYDDDIFGTQLKILGGILLTRGMPGITVDSKTAATFLQRKFGGGMAAGIGWLTPLTTPGHGSTDPTAGNQVPVISYTSQRLSQADGDSIWSQLVALAKADPSILVPGRIVRVTVLGASTQIRMTDTIIDRINRMMGNPLLLPMSRRDP